MCPWRNAPSNPGFKSHFAFLNDGNHTAPFISWFHTDWRGLTKVKHTLEISRTNSDWLYGRHSWLQLAVLYRWLVVKWFPQLLNILIRGFKAWNVQQHQCAAGEGRQSSWVSFFWHLAFDKREEMSYLWNIWRKRCFFYLRFRKIWGLQNLSENICNFETPFFVWTKLWHVQ